MQIYRSKNMEKGGHAMPSRQYHIPETKLLDQLIGPVCKDGEGIQWAWGFMLKHEQ